MLKIGPIRNLEKVQAYLKTVPRGAVKDALVAITKYIIGDKNHGLVHDDPYRQTTRKKVYGQTFESDKQRRYVMAAIKDGRIKLGQRKHNPTDQSKGYGYKLTKGGYGATITNEKESAYWARGWGGWKNWRSVPKVIDANIKGALRAAASAVNKALKKK